MVAVPTLGFLREKNFSRKGLQKFYQFGKLKSLMNALLYSPTGVAEYDPSLGISYPLPFLPTPEELASGKTPTLEAYPDDTGSEYATQEYVGDDGCTPWSVRYERSSGYIIDDFTWCSADGTLYDLQDMATPHLFYALRMVWNHSVPRVWRVGNYKEYPDVPKWHPNYRKQAIEALANEIAQRDDDLNEDQRQQLFEMVLKTIYIVDLGI